MKLLTYTMFFLIMIIIISSSKLRKTYSIFDVVNEKILRNKHLYIHNRDKTVNDTSSFSIIEKNKIYNIPVSIQK